MDSPGTQDATGWWVTEGDQVPLGPMSSRHLVALILSGEARKEALVCEVGGSAWRPLVGVAEFKSALDRFDRDFEFGGANLERVSHQAFEDLQEQTIVERPSFALPGLDSDNAADDDDLPTIRPRGPVDDSE